jgi:hypothetical protein
VNIAEFEGPVRGWAFVVKRGDLRQCGLPPIDPWVDVNLDRGHGWHGPFNGFGSPDLEVLFVGDGRQRPGVGERCAAASVTVEKRVDFPLQSSGSKAPPANTMVREFARTSRRSPSLP